MRTAHRRIRRSPVFRAGIASCAGALLPALVMVLLLAGCAAKAPTAAPGKANADEVWKLFKAPCAEKAPFAAFSLNASLSFAAQTASGRLNARFWGDVDGPLRLDFTTPVGSPFAMWREDATGWLAYYPGDGAFSHPDTRKGMAKLGMPLPFDLRELAGAAMGRACEFVPDVYVKAKIAPQGYEYLFGADAPLKSLILDFEGEPVRMTGRGIEPWTADLEEYAPVEGFSRPMAQRITLVTPGGTQARLRVKKIETRAEPWDDKALELYIPTGITVLPLDLMDDVHVVQP